MIGGKIEPDKSAQASLIRELLEEMNINFEPGVLFDINEHIYGIVTIRLIECWLSSSMVQFSSSIMMTTHG
jgi:8-oxo-dGTP pyrophosphatase MutT (NUDIX family)